MFLEDQRYIHEDLERLEQAIADRIGDEPKHIRDRLNRDHEIAQLLEQIKSQSANLLKLYRDEGGQLTDEIQQIGTGDSFEEFNREVARVRNHNARYPTEQAQNAEQRYRARRTADGDMIPYIVDTLFSGEEAFGRFFDLHVCHDSYLNLPGVKRLTYLQYLEVFDDFSPGAGGVKKDEKLTDQYFRYLGELAEYLESFMRRVRPLENVDKVIAGFDEEFEEAWGKDEVEGWKSEAGAVNGNGRVASSPDAVYCEDCEKEFKNENVHKAHLTGRKHIRAAEKRAQRRKEEEEGAKEVGGGGMSARRLKEKAIAEREFRIKRLTSAMSTERSDTKINVERKQGMTERERQQELDNLMNMTGPIQEATPRRDGEDEDDEDDDEKIYNPLKLPLAWDGKPIPFWLYKLHGLGAEYPCEICGNFVYMGRRAYEKHFNEARHIHGLRCLGITRTGLFKEIPNIHEALQLWEKIQKEERANAVDEGSMVQMEDGEGNVMPENVYYDLLKQGIL